MWKRWAIVQKARLLFLLAMMVSDDGSPALHSNARRTYRTKQAIAKGTTPGRCTTEGLLDYLTDVAQVYVFDRSTRTGKINDESLDDQVSAQA